MTPAQTSAAPAVVPLGASRQIFASHRSERVGFGLLGLLVIALAVVMFRTSNSAVDNLKVISDSGSTSYNMVVTQHESLLFAVAFEQWLGGTITRRELQIRRALLAQRLIVRDDTGVVNGTRIPLDYFAVLRVLDGYIKVAPSGLLPPADRTVLRTKSSDALKEFAFESREMMKRVSGEMDEQTRQRIRNENTRRTNQYVVVLAILALMSLVTGFLAVSRHRSHQMATARAANERRELEGIRTALERAEVALAARLDLDRMERLDREWIDSGVRSIAEKMRGTVVPDEISELLVEGLGRTLGADFVVFCSFGEFQKSRIVKQWTQPNIAQIDISQITNHEPRLSDLARYLEKISRAIVVTDSRLSDASRDPFPDLLTLSQELARSWILAPVGTANHGFGYVWIGMVNNPRVWSSAEVEFIQQVDAEAAQVLSHAWIFSQAMRIAENDAVVERLVELDNAKDDFIENMNHELRTPLTSIIGYLEMIVGDVNPDVEPELASSLSVVQRNAIRLQSLVENMMQVSKTNFNDASLMVSTVDIGHVLGDAVKSVELSAEDCGVEVTLRLDSPAGDLLIDGDVNQLEQVFVNLMSNAIKFTPRGGQVTIVARRTHTGDDCVEVKVIDTGIGIPPEDFPNVFKRFFRASTATKAAIPGFGIGLSLVQSIVHEHHGTITFDSTVGRGTVFTVILPARYVSIRSSKETE